MGVKVTLTVQADNGELSHIDAEPKARPMRPPRQQPNP